MKNALIFLLIGAVIGALSYHLYLKPDATGTGRATTASVVERTKEAATEAKDAIAAKFEAWQLTPADLRRDLATANKIVRHKAKAAGESMSDARIVAVIKGKYAIDSELSALAISIDCTAGRVTLSGAVASLDLIGQAIRLALETDGVTEVESLLTVAGGA